MPGKDEITIGQIYWLQPTHIARVLFDVKDGTVPLKNGLFPKIYSFGLVGDRCITLSYIDGNSLILENGRKISTFDGELGTEFVYDTERRRFNELRHDIEFSLAMPEHEKPRQKIVRREVTRLESLDDIGMLVPDMDILPIYHNSSRKLALFEGSQGHLVHLLFRHSDGFVKKIRRSIFDTRKMSLSTSESPIHLEDSELKDAGEDYVWDTTDPAQSESIPESFGIRDKLLKSKGIYKNDSY